MTTGYQMLDRAPGQHLMTVPASDIERIEEYDPDPDLSYFDADADPDYNANNAESVHNLLRSFGPDGRGRPGTADRLRCLGGRFRIKKLTFEGHPGDGEKCP